MGQPWPLLSRFSPAALGRFLRRTPLGKRKTCVQCVGFTGARSSRRSVSPSPPARFRRPPFGSVGVVDDEADRCVRWRGLLGAQYFGAFLPYPRGYVCGGVLRKSPQIVAPRTRPPEGTRAGIWVAPETTAGDAAIFQAWEIFRGVTGALRTPRSVCRQEHPRGV